MCRLKAVIGVLGEARTHHVLEGWRRERLGRGDRLRIFFHNCAGHADLAVSLKCPFAGCHFVQDCPQRKQVRSRVSFLTLNLFRRHVLDRANHFPHAGQRRQGACFAHCGGG